MTEPGRETAVELYAVLLAAYVEGTEEAVSAAVQPDVVYEIHGETRLSGTYRGVAGMLTWMNRARDLSHGTVRFAPAERWTNETGIVVVGEATVERDGVTLATPHLYRLRWRDNRLVEGHTHGLDPASFTRVWG